MKSVIISLITLSVVILIVSAAARINHWQEAQTIQHLNYYAWLLLGVNVSGLLMLWVKEKTSLRSKR